ncbi:MAG TPA: hypothetical protein VJV41_27285 [Mycobacterium sp.]|nr:hypothetical protein [Mycobacterium sp.]HKP44640.1 hypothetical protein [Mycobacterium sp.]
MLAIVIGDHHLDHQQLGAGGHGVSHISQNLAHFKFIPGMHDVFEHVRVAARRRHR